MADDLRRAVGGNLRAIRRARGLTQEKFGHHLGYERSWIGHVENGKRNLTMDSIQQLADRLAVEVFILVQRPLLTATPPPLAESADQDPGKEETGDEEPR